MLLPEQVTIDGIIYDKFVSPTGNHIRWLANGALYDEAICPVNSGYQFEDTDIPIVRPEEEEPDE